MILLLKKIKLLIDSDVTHSANIFHVIIFVAPRQVLELWGILCTSAHFSTFASVILVRITRSFDFQKYAFFDLVCPVAWVTML